MSHSWSHTKNTPPHCSSTLPLRGCSPANCSSPISTLWHPLLCMVKAPQKQVHPLLLRPEKTGICIISSRGCRLAIYALDLLANILATLRGPFNQYYWSSYRVVSPFPSLFLPLSLPLGTQGSVGCLTASICICLSQMLVDPHKGQLVDPVCTHIFASATFS